MTPHHLPSLLFLPATWLSQTHEVLFEQTQRPSRAVSLTSRISSRTTKILGHHQVWCNRRIGHLESDANLDYVLVKKHTILNQSLIVRSQKSRIELVTRPATVQPHCLRPLDA